MEVIESEIGELNVLESMCPECREKGVTRLLFVDIPHFKRVIVSSFECHNASCGLENREVQFGDEYPPYGTRFRLNASSKEDLNRQIVKSEYAVIFVPELDLEIPAQTQGGTINTLEGILRKVSDDLAKEQELRRQYSPDIAIKIDLFIQKIDQCLNLQMSFHITLDDCSGNSHIETFPGDKKLTRVRYSRSIEQRLRIGLAVENAYSTTRTDEEEAVVEAAQMEDIYDFPETCTNCGKYGVVKMHKVDIPFFKEVIIMAFTCDHCGYRDSEVRSGGAIASKGVRITLKVQNTHDLCRDVLRTETSTIRIPEIDFDLESGHHVGGAFTTVEGLLTQILEHLQSTQVLSFSTGDSADNKQKTTWASFLSHLNRLREGVEPFTLILDDPTGNIYVQNPKAHLLPPDNVDDQLLIEEYERTEEQNDELGITDMRA